jgi:hypothetical protein
VLAQNLGDSSRQRRLAVIDVADRADVYVRLTAIKFFLRHDVLRLYLCCETVALRRFARADKFSAPARGLRVAKTVCTSGAKAPLKLRG